MSDLFNADEYADWQHEDDDGAQAQLASERHEAVVRAIWGALMHGVDEAQCRLLCAETGVRWEQVQTYRDPLTIPKEETHRHILWPL